MSLKLFYKLFFTSIGNFEVEDIGGKVPDNMAGREIPGVYEPGVRRKIQVFPLELLAKRPAYGYKQA